MKLGADNRKKTIGAVVLFLVALFLFFRTFVNSGTPASAAQPATTTSRVIPELPGAGNEPAQAPAPVRRRSTRRDPRQQPQQQSFTASLDPRLRLDLLSAAEQTEYMGSGRNIFRLEAEPIPQPIESPIKRGAETARDLGPPQPPPPPPINLKFFGFASSPGEPKQVFLSTGEDVFVAREGDIVNRRYKVLRIGNNFVEVEDMLNNNRQSLPLTS
jgi:hypothetical protein